jgi:uncharacterized membrane protein YheB (UPF0754 family)
MVNDTAQPILADKVEQQAERSASQGKLDEQLGKTDQKRVAEDRAYERGVKRVAVENATVKAISEWQNRYENEIDKSVGEKLSQYTLQSVLEIIEQGKS